MRAETYIDRSQLESNIRAQRIPRKLLRDALNILETYDEYLNIWKEKKEDDKRFVLSLGAFNISPQEIKNALHFLQWIPLADEYGEDCYDKRKLTLEGFFNGIYIEQTGGPSPYSEEAIFGFWNYTQKDEVRIFLKTYLANNKEESSVSTSNHNKTILKINKSKMQVTKDNSLLVCAFRKVGGKNLRFEYILNLAKTSTKISAKKLRNKTIQNISSEIDEINERLKENLELTEDVIKNDDNSGYEINREIYEINFG